MHHFLTSNLGLSSVLQFSCSLYMSPQESRNTSALKQKFNVSEEAVLDYLYIQTRVQSRPKLPLKTMVERI